MQNQDWSPFSSRWVCSRCRSAVALTCLLVSLLAFGGCGGGGNDGSGTDTDEDGREPIPVVASCEGDIFIQAPVEAIDAQTLSLLDLTIGADDQTRFNDITLADLAVGDYVDTRGFVDVDGVIVASCLEREKVARDNVELRGPVDENGIAGSNLFILGVEVQITANTVFEDGNLTQSEFFDQLLPGDLVAVKGQLGSIRAESVEFDDRVDDEVVGGSNDEFNDNDDDDDDFSPPSDLDDDDDGMDDDDGVPDLDDDDDDGSDDDDDGVSDLDDDDDDGSDDDDDDD